MVLEGTVSELAQQVLGGAYRIRLEANGVAGLEAKLNQLRGVVKVSRADSSGYNLEAKSDLRAEAARAIVEAGGRLLSLSAEMPSLDEIYTRYFHQQEVAHVGAS
jgi:ABC-2 type transport system ATP-binding protein